MSKKHNQNKLSVDVGTLADPNVKEAEDATQDSLDGDTTPEYLNSSNVAILEQDVQELAEIENISVDEARDIVEAEGLSVVNPSDEPEELTISSVADEKFSYDEEQGKCSVCEEKHLKELKIRVSLFKCEGFEKLTPPELSVDVLGTLLSIIEDGVTRAFDAGDRDGHGQLSNFHMAASELVNKANHLSSAAVEFLNK